MSQDQFRTHMSPEPNSGHRGIPKSTEKLTNFLTAPRRQAITSDVNLTGAMHVSNRTLCP